MVLRRIGPLSAGKITAVLYALLGLIIGGLMTLFALMGGSPAAEPGAADAMGGYGAMFGMAAVVVLPIVWGIVGFIAGLISAFCFNIAAKIGGGVDLDLS